MTWLRKRCALALAGALFSLLGGGGLALAQSCPGAPLGDPYRAEVPRGGAHDPNLIDWAVLHYTNKARCAEGLSPLGNDSSLRAAADIHSRDMAQIGFFDHTSPVAGHETLKKRVTLAGVRYRRAAENIIEARYMNYRSGESFYIDNEATCQFRYTDNTPLRRHTYDSLAEQLVRRWMNSPGHRRNILTPELDRHGFALAPNKDTALCGGLYGTQVFAG